MEWHLRWTSDVRMLYHVNRYRWSGLKRLRFALGHARRRDPAVISDEGAPKGAV